MDSLWGVLIGVSSGIISTINYGKCVDKLSIALSLTEILASSFWAKIVLIEIFAVKLG